MKLTNKKSNHTSNLSCRLDGTLYNSLVADAESKGVSVNSLVNSIVKHHLTWRRFSDEVGFVPITKRTLKKIFRTMDYETIKKIAKDVGGTVPKELIYLSYDSFDFNNLMSVIEISGGRFGKVNHMNDNAKHTINIVHGVCEHFSRFLAETHQTLADDLSIGFKVQHLDNNMVCMVFEDPKNSYS